MRIVLTGCDRTGKSTFAAKLVEKLGYPYYHFSKPPKEAFKYFGNVFNTPHAIVDRWIEGDSIYAKACGHKAMLTVEQKMLHLERAAAEGLAYIFFIDDPAAIRQRFIDCGEDFLKPEQVEKVQELMLEEARQLAELRLFTVLVVNVFTKEYVPLFTADLPGFTLNAELANAKV